MFVLGVAVIFAGVLSEIVAAGQRATLLMFVLPACTPVGPLSERLLGWVIALALCVPAALFLFPPRHHDDLRRHAARVCNRLADRLEGTATARDVTKAMNALYETFIGADYRPVALTAGSRALVRVVDDLGWLSDRVTDDTGRAARGDEGTRGAGTAGLRGGAPAAQPCRAGGPQRRPARCAHRAAVDGAGHATATTSRRCCARPTMRRRSRSGRALLNRRTVVGHHRGDGPDHPQRRGRGRPAGLGPGARPPVARDRRSGLGDAGNRRRRRNHQGIPRRLGRWCCATACAPGSGWRSPSR